MQEQKVKPFGYLSCLLILASPASAQSLGAGGTIAGTVLDPTGAAGATQYSGASPGGRVFQRRWIHSH